MKNVKDELQHIILGNESSGQGSKLKKTQAFLRRYAKTGVDSQKEQYFKHKEAEAILTFSKEASLFYSELTSLVKVLNKGYFV